MSRGWGGCRTSALVLGELLFDDLVAEVDALVAMYTPGPAMSFLTALGLPQKKEQFSSSPVSPNFATVASSFPQVQIETCRDVNESPDAVNGWRGTR